MSFKIQSAPSSDTVTKTFRIPSDMIDYLDKLACSHNLSLNALVIQCLQYAIDNLDADDEG